MDNKKKEETTQEEIANEMKEHMDKGVSIRKWQHISRDELHERKI